jgi:hypothetical protein
MIIMQLENELVLISSMTIVIISGIVGTYFFRLWYKQKTRLITDLPLVFAVMAIGQACQNVIVTLQNLGILDDSVFFLKIRSLIIACSIIPLFGAVLQIWLPRIRKYHVRILAGISIYWAGVVVLGPTSEFVMALTIPLILISGLMMMVTFIITWKTGRLKEIRSSVVVLTIPIMLASQILRVPLLNTPLFYVPDLLLFATLVIMPFAFIGVDAEKKSAQVEQVQPPKPLEATVEY